MTCRARHHSGFLSSRRPSEQRQSIAINCRTRHHNAWLSPRLPSVQWPDQRPHLSCPLPQSLAEPTPTIQLRPEQRPSQSCPPNRGWLSLGIPSEQRPRQRPHLSCPPSQWLDEPTPTERTEDRAAISPVVPASTVAIRAHAVRANRGQSSALTSRARRHSGWPSPGLPGDQTPEQRPHLSCTPTPWLADPTPTERKKSHGSAINYCTRHHSGLLSPCRPSVQRLDQRPNLSCLPVQWLPYHTPTE
jgi:hypothetical protein